MIDLHTHSIFSDGELIPSELVRRAVVHGYSTIAITDHVDFTNIEFVLGAMEKISDDTAGIRVLSGVELTHVPPERIAPLADKARALGADIIVVHGETIVEPVAPGTNAAALQADIDILAHPGLITADEAELARENGILLEITSRAGHSLTNGHVARIACETGCGLIVNTDTHAPDDLITDDMAMKVAMGCGLSERDAVAAVRTNPNRLVESVRR
ncbi:MAG: histidinol phosphate phosphatase domain-containing protein [Methanosarcinales archaeon]|nr:histidinol phosphate phosphatase domain-containing protein [Methanosarcinales archaeon]